MLEIVGSLMCKEQVVLVSFHLWYYLRLDQSNDVYVHF